MFAKKYKIFIVDDDKDFLYALKSRLANNKMYDISCFNTGEDCLKKRHLAPEIVILNYNLNSKDKNAMNGVEIIKELKKENPLTIVILLSAQDDVEVTSSTINYGVYDYVQKSESSILKIENMIKNITASLKLRVDYEADSNFYKKFHLIAILIFILLLILNRLLQD